MASEEVIGRLAPSPTGCLHLGHARSFLLAYWHARSRNGRLILRIEDVDVARAKQEHVERAIVDLEWLGIEWDGPARLQSEGIPRMQKATERLAEEGLAYACTCSRGDLRAAGAGQLRYPGTCRGRFSSRQDAKNRTARDAGLRLTVPPGDVAFLDENFGPQGVDVQAEVGDFLIVRRNGMPSYQCAVVLDDAYDGVTEVVRGADLLSSTARQIVVQRALGLGQPRYFHVGLVCDQTGRRLAKRERDLGLFELREAGVDPKAIVGWAALTSGQTDAWHGAQGRIPRLAARELLPHFDMKQVPLGPVVLPPDPVAMLR